MAFDLKKEEDVKEYLEKLGIEYRFGCFHEKNPEVCHLLADYLESIKKDFAKAAKIYRTNCDDYNFGRSCYKYGNYRLTGKGSNDKGSNAEALKYHEKGCALKDPEACLNMGLMLVAPIPDIKSNVRRGYEALQVSCSKNNANACYFLSGMCITGVLSDEATKKVGEKRQSNAAAQLTSSDYIIPKNMADAFKYSHQACDLDHIYACVNLSQMYSKGEGVAKNLDLAEKFKKKALDMQETILKQKESLTFQQGLK